MVLVVSALERNKPIDDIVLKQPNTKTMPCHFETFEVFSGRKRSHLLKTTKAAAQTKDSLKAQYPHLAPVDLGTMGLPV